MRVSYLVLLLAVAPSAWAQPGYAPPLIINPCGLPANDSLDVTGDGIPDLFIGGWSVGTDDEPSSSGSCTRYVGTLPGTTLLCGLDHTGQRVPYGFAHGDTLPALYDGLQDELRIPRFVFTEGTILVLQWGYGNAWSMPAMPPGLAERVHVFQTIAQERVVRTFTIQVDEETRAVRISTGDLVRSDKPMIIR
jgi:hypothetical protein